MKSDPAAPLRILAIVDLPWDPKLGASHVWIELTKEWKKAGHSVDKFCLTDAFPQPATSRAASVFQQLRFPRRAARYVRENADRFDVIDCSIGSLPFSKKSLRFRGLLVARSVGLFRSYYRFMRLARERWPAQPKGRVRGQLFYPFFSWLLARNGERAIRHCDVVNLPNEDEVADLHQGQTPPKAAIVQPYGLSETDRAALEREAAPPAERLAKKTLSFVGMWSLRKGSKDWGEIIRRVQDEVPEARFLFLGTMVDEEKVRADLGDVAADAVRCVSSFQPEELPKLLGECAVGLFPSYIEGFGIAVLEQLAAGIPTVAYDVPGPRQIMKDVRTTLLVPAGDAAAMAERAVALLTMEPEDYITLTRHVQSVASSFRWEKIAAETALQYRAALQALP
jgi:glycosyltransferase involved in cell wall biosynthesis